MLYDESRTAPFEIQVLVGIETIRGIPDGGFPIGDRFRLWWFRLCLRHGYTSRCSDRSGHLRIPSIPDEIIRYAVFMAGVGHADDETELIRYRIRFPSPSAFVDRFDVCR